MRFLSLGLVALVASACTLPSEELEHTSSEIVAPQGDPHPAAVSIFYTRTGQRRAVGSGFAPNWRRNRVVTAAHVAEHIAKPLPADSEETLMLFFWSSHGVETTTPVLNIPIRRNREGKLISPRVITHPGYIDSPLGETMDIAVLALPKNINAYKVPRFPTVQFSDHPPAIGQQLSMTGAMSNGQFLPTRYPKAPPAHNTRFVVRAVSQYCINSDFRTTRALVKERVNSLPPINGNSGDSGGLLYADKVYGIYFRRSDVFVLGLQAARHPERFPRVTADGVARMQSQIVNDSCREPLNEFADALPDPTADIDTYPIARVAYTEDYLRLDRQAVAPDGSSIYDWLRNQL